MSRTSPSLALLSAVLALVVPAAPRAQTHAVHVLDGGGPVFATPRAINAAGQIAGEGEVFQQSAENQPMVWAGGMPSLLPLLPGDDFGRALGLDSHGTLVGESAAAVMQGTALALERHAVRWSAGQVAALSDDVTSGPPLELLTALDIDDAGRIIGEGLATPGGPTRGWLLDHGQLTELGGLTPGGALFPRQIGAFGRVVGFGTAADGWEHAFVWQSGVLHDLHDAAHGILGSRAFDLDAAGRIVGSADFIVGGELLTFAVLWKPDGTLLNLGHVDIPDESEPPGPDASEALGINALGDVVGISQDYGHGTIGFLWRDGVMRDLNDLVALPEPGFVIYGATDIDDTGRIVAFGGTTVPKAVLLVPDGGGGYLAYGAGCAGSGGITPVLGGLGQPSPGAPAGIALTVGLGGAHGLLLLGLSDQPLPFKPGCTFEIAPLLSLVLPLSLPGAGAGNGTLVIPTVLPASAPSVEVFLQAAFADAGAEHGVSLSNALRMSVR